MEVRLERLRPSHIEKAMERCPVLFQPLGTIEWHGRHNIVGLDAVKAHELCVRAAQRYGGLVAPAVYGGIGGLDQPHTFVIEPEIESMSKVFRLWLERLAAEALRQGYKGVIFLTGHYGRWQQMLVRETAVRMTKVFNAPVFGTPEYFLALNEGYHGDHAAAFETSLMMHLFPDSVDLSELGDPPHQGVGGRDPKLYATAEDGRRMCEAIIECLGRLAEQMPTWDTETIAAFAQAEQALVDRQIQLAGQSRILNCAWQKIPQGAFTQYADLLVSRRFTEIVELVQTL